MNKEQKEALMEYQKSTLNINKKSKTNKIVKIILIIILIYILLVHICTKLGDYFYLPIKSGERYTKFYEIRLNDISFNVSINRKELVPIIPKVFYWDCSEDSSSLANENEDDFIISDKYILNAKIYSCYSNYINPPKLVSCNRLKIKKIK